MLKNKLWIVALFAALTMAFFGCTNLAEGLDDGSGPVPAEDLVLEGSKIVLGSVGSTSSIIDGTKVTILGGTSTGFYVQLPADGVDVYPNVIVYFKVDSVMRGRPGLLMKTTNQLNANVGGVDNEDDSYQLNDVGLEGTEFNTGLQRANQFTNNRFVFQHQAWQPSNANSDAEYTIEVLKVVFPGTGGGAVDEGYPPRTITIGSGSETATGNIFYVNLNDKRDGVAIPTSPFDASRDIPADPTSFVLTKDPDATPPRNDIELTFTKRNQRAFFKLTNEQIGLLREADSAKVTVTATRYVKPGDTAFNFRFGLADSLATSNWNATSLPTTLNSEEALTFARKTGNTLGYFVIQSQDDNDETTLRVESIKIETIKKNFGNLTIVKSVVQAGSPAAEVGAYLSAALDGVENPTYTWKRKDGTVISNEKTIYVVKSVIETYTVTISLYGYNSKSEFNDDYDVKVSIPLYFDVATGTATTGKLLVTPQLGFGSASTFTTETDNSGFTFTYGGAETYGGAFVAFPITFPASNTWATPSTAVTDVPLGMITKVTFTFEGLAGDIGWKQLRVQTKTATTPGTSPYVAGLGDNDLVGSVGTNNNGAALEYTVNISSALTGEVWFVIYCNADGRSGVTSYKITDVELHN